jgi:hypothetical protein
MALGIWVDQWHINIDTIENISYLDYMCKWILVGNNNSLLKVQSK